MRLQPSLASLLLRAGAVRPRVGERRAGPERAVAWWEAWGACRSPSYGVEWGHIRPPGGASRGRSEPHGLLISARAGA